MPDRVVARAPATVANLGPGFDALGFALAWYDEVRIERHAGPFELSAAGVGAEHLPRDASNLTARAVERVLGSLDGVRIHKTIAVAYGRGFGSSAAAIVGGLVAARAFGATAHSDDDLLKIAIEIEGHPDNVAPSLLGGITVCAGERVLRLDPPSSIVPLVCVASSRLSTSTARGAVPDQVARAVAVANIGRAALLAASLATGRDDMLLEATEDLLHQPPRFALMPDTGDLVAALRANGIAAFLSGAGPSVTALVPTAHAAAAEQIAHRLAPEGWQVRAETFDARGACLVEQR